MNDADFTARCHHLRKKKLFPHFSTNLGEFSTTRSKSASKMRHLSNACPFFDRSNIVSFVDCCAFFTGIFSVSRSISVSNALPPEIVPRGISLHCAADRVTNEIGKLAFFFADSGSFPSTVRQAASVAIVQNAFSPKMLLDCFPLFVPIFWSFFNRNLTFF
jgi:hypothetical protein